MLHHIGEHKDNNVYVTSDVPKHDSTLSNLTNNLITYINNQ